MIPSPKNTEHSKDEHHNIMNANVCVLLNNAKAAQNANVCGILKNYSNSYFWENENWMIEGNVGCWNNKRNYLNQ